MGRIQDKFEELKKENRKALVTFMTAGDPDHETSQTILNSLPANGADIIELGMPFSDPMADGPAIQRANIRALNSGASMEATLQLVKSFRVNDTKTPIVLMGYFNPIYNYGTDRFIAKAAETGVDGLIVVDVPPEEDEELNAAMRNHDMDLIRLVSPTTDTQRLELIIGHASGFLYYVSIAGVTGTKSADVESVSAHIKMIREKTDLPIAVGFGIKTPDDVKTMSAIADAAVVGSAIVDTIGKIGEGSASANDLAKQVQALAAAVK